MFDHLPAILLLGPTGSGKTPLGELLELRGLAGHRCLHFDFGENLRQIVATNEPDELISADDLAYLRGVLDSGALLEDEDFPLAGRILESFLARRSATAVTRLILNGLPRHIGQAEALAEMLDMEAVVCLLCSPETVQTRIGTNTGGDRSGRVDDDLSAVRRKLAIFAERTAPLVEYFRARDVPVLSIVVGEITTPEAIWETLEREYRSILGPDR